MVEKKDSALGRYNILTDTTKDAAFDVEEKPKSWLQRLWESFVPAPEPTPKQVKAKIKNRKKAKVQKVSRKKNRRK